MFLTSNRSVGNFGENLACQFLQQKGYKILCRNYTIRGGEIDIIAQDKDCLVFVEVKLRTNTEYGKAIESVTYNKLKSLQKSATFYINLIRWGDRPYRFDLVTIDKENGEYKISVEKNIIEG